MTPFFSPKKVSALLSFGLCAAFLTACGNPPPATSTAEPAVQTSDLLNRINNQGTLVVGTEGTYPPFTYHDESGKLTGYDVEVTRAIADKLGMGVEFKETQWDAMLAGLDAKRFDAVANQMSLTTPERQAKYDKSEPYSWSNSVVVAPVGVAINSWKDINGKQSAQSMSSHYAEVAEKYGAVLVPVEGMAQAVTLVQQGRADMTINDKLAMLDYFTNQPNHGLEIKLYGDDADQRGAGLAFVKGNEEAVAKISEATRQLKADGTLAKLGEQFFGKDVSEKQ